jgi:hypothetical protein
MQELLPNDRLNAANSAQLKKSLKDNNGPKVMTVVVQGHHVIFASSKKGPGLLYDPKKEPIVVPSTGKTETYWRNYKGGVCPVAIEKSLKECGMLVSGALVGHQNGGSCGEVMAGWALCDHLPDAQISPAMVVTVERLRDGSLVVKDPCGAEDGDVSVSLFLPSCSGGPPTNSHTGMDTEGLQDIHQSCRLDRYPEWD